MELTVAQKLDALLKLQAIDSQLNDIRKMRGDLPEEVRDLEDEIAGFETRIGKFNSEVSSLQEEVDQPDDDGDDDRRPDEPLDELGDGFARLAEALTRLGFVVTPSQANFVWARREDRPTRPQSHQSLPPP